jgi:hypothetical protein
MNHGRLFMIFYSLFSPSLSLSLLFSLDEEMDFDAFVSTLQGTFDSDDGVRSNSERLLEEVCDVHLIVFFPFYEGWWGHESRHL